MIFPLLRGFLFFRKAPVTWLLVALNGAVLMWSWSATWSSGDQLDDLMSESYFVETQGRMYDAYLRDHHAADVIRDIASSSPKDPHHFRLLGHMAFRDEEFLKDAPSLHLFSDEVAVHHWKKQLSMINDLEAVHPSFLLGISSHSSGPRQWLTYIFSHGNGWHYFGNMIFLVIFGAALEQMIGGLALLVIFLMTGIFAAGFFLWLCGPSTAPLIGASGAISGVMAMYCVMMWNRPCRFVYWLFIPTREAMGFVFLPAWIIFAIWFLGDMAGYYGNVDLLGGVAHAAHLGGDVAGIISGLVVMALWKKRGKKIDDGFGSPESWRLFPFFQWHRQRLDAARR